MTIETRTNIHASLRAVVDGKATMIEGLAAAYDKLSIPIAGLFLERIAPGTFANALARRPDARALIDHDSSKIIGRISAGTLRLADSRRGLVATIELPSTTYASDLAESIRRGDVSVMSFGFNVVADEWGQVTVDKTTWPLRVITDLELIEVSVVTFPAYPQTSIAVK